MKINQLLYDFPIYINNLPKSQTFWIWKVKR